MLYQSTYTDKFTPLTEDQLFRSAPSIFTNDVHDRVSDKYKQISTIDLVRGLAKEGFLPVKAIQCKSRLHDKVAYAKHMIRFRHIDQNFDKHGLFPELVLVNSHDGLSSYRLMAGLYRMICSNGLIAGDTYQEVRVKHQGDILGNVIEGSYHVIEDTKNMLEHADNMSGITLNKDEKIYLAEAAHTIAFDDKSSFKEAIQPTQLLRPRRYAESGKDDLFTTFNIIQENVIKGGIQGMTIDANGRRRYQSTREVKAIDRNNSLNRALWTLAERMQELKQGS